MPNSFRFLLKSRLRKNTDIQKIFKKHKRLNSSYYLIYFDYNHLNFPRLGVVVSKRNVRHAISRNRIKRVVREKFRIKQFELGNFDLVIVAKKGVIDASNQELDQCLEKLFAKLSGHYNLSSLHS